jgi:hypothetical protein
MIEGSSESGGKSEFITDSLRSHGLNPAVSEMVAQGKFHRLAETLLRRRLSVRTIRKI